MQCGGELDLSGTWRAAPADDAALKLSYVDDDLDDRGWEQLQVPGHWRSSPAFAHHDGPVLYRRRFDAPDPAGADDSAGNRSFLVFDGVLAASDVWLDGSYLGDTSGYVVPHSFEVTDLLRARSEHLLAMEVSCAPVGPGRTRDLTGGLGRSALLGDGHNPGGIWRPVRVTHTGPVRLRYSRLRCPEASAARATLALRAVLDTLEARTVTIRTSVQPSTDDGGHGTGALAGGAPLVVEREHALATGENRLEWTVTVPDPNLWWPRALGEQPLYDVHVEIVVAGTVSDHRRWRTGLREVRMDGFRCRVNGEQLFLKGLALGPTRVLLAEASPEEVAADVTRAAEAGLDLLRVHGHVSRPELYAEADARGILLWQDLPLQWGLQRAAKAPARRLARAAVDQLAHHPSIAVWCAHHEPWAGDPASWRSGERRATRRRRVRALVAQVAPSWNRTVLDRSVVVALEQSDGSRPVVAHSGIWPHPPQLAGTSTHLWAGWRWGDIDSLPRLVRWWPRVGRFVAEFGAQAPGDDGLEALLHAGRAGQAEAADGGSTAGTPPWPVLDWPAVAAATGFEVPSAARSLPPGQHADAESWGRALRAHQAELVRSHIEALRRLKYRPTGGFAAFALADPAPAVSAALLDDQRRPKPAWDALREACAPVIAVIDRPPAVLRPGASVDLEVHVANDLRVEAGPLTVIATATWHAHREVGAVEGNVLITHRSGWAGEVPADAVARVGTFRMVVPHLAATMRLELVLWGPDGELGRRVHERPVEPAG
jgi:beta-mannosidase